MRNKMLDEQIRLNGVQYQYQTQIQTQSDNTSGYDVTIISYTKALTPRTV